MKYGGSFRELSPIIMAVRLRIAVFVIILVVCSSVNSCSIDRDCHEGQYCCKQHCTAKKIRCSELCNRDEDCSRKELCIQHVCIACSKRLRCELKGCTNNTHCPVNYECTDNKCTKMEPPKAFTSFLPFIIIIGVLGFAVFVLCYTEGCWKEVFQYIRRRYANYGSLAREEWEVEDTDEGIRERGSNNTRHCVRPKTRGRERARGSHDHNSEPFTAVSERNNRQQQSSNLSNTVSCTETVSYDRETNSISVVQLMDQNQIRRGLRDMFYREMTSLNSGTVCQHEGSETLLPSGMIPSFTVRQDVANTTDNSLESLPTYGSLFSEENNEPPPPSYDDVVNSDNATALIHVVRYTSSLHDGVTETVV